MIRISVVVLRKAAKKHASKPVPPKKSAPRKHTSKKSPPKKSPSKPSSVSKSTALPASGTNALQAEDDAFYAFNSAKADDKVLSKTVIDQAVAYQPPTQPTPVAFGKSVIRLQKPTNYWKVYRKFRFFSFKLVWIRTMFIIGISYLCAFIWTEIRQIEDEQRRGGRAQYALTGEALGKKIIPPHQREIYDEEKVNAEITRALTAKEGQYQNDDYEMVKIPRPRELTFDDVRKR
mmetsp:Transcript_8475/g.12820  ORF Transcript_8475/g.12820 Transcript_8475/m.12820 type:complete len:233 (-) Transcript_8475:18-716(-)